MIRKMLLLAIVSFLVIPLHSATPVIDGAFDGEGVWGTPQATADGTAGWVGINVDKLYVTYDADSVYFAATFHSDGYPDGWMRVAFDINVKADGGWNCPWGAAVSYAYTPDDEKPDFVLIGRLGTKWAELRDWNGSDWGGGGINIFDADMEWDTTAYSYVECRIAKSTLGDVDLCDVQFYVSGDNDTQHGVFDACPDDEVMTSWDDPTELDNYAPDIQIKDPSAIAVDDAKTPRRFSLEQNYPNPFNPSTVIRYQLPEASRVQLTVYDALGKKVSALVQAEQSAGTHQITFNAAHLPNGLYFYKLNAGSFEQVRKMVLMK